MINILHCVLAAVCIMNVDYFSSSQNNIVFIIVYYSNILFGTLADEFTIFAVSCLLVFQDGEESKSSFE